MTLIPVEVPTELPLSLAEMRAQCRLTDDDGTDEDALMMDFVRSAVAWIDGADGWLKRALITQTWDYEVDRLPGIYCGWPGPTRWAQEMTLPLPPLQAVDSVTYLDEDGNGQVLPPSAYRVVGARGGLPARLTGVPNYAGPWPLGWGPYGITIRFTAGYGDNWNHVPDPIRQALRMLAAYWFNQREAGLIDPVILEVPFAVKALLANYRVRSYG